MRRIILAAIAGLTLAASAVAATRSPAAVVTDMIAAGNQRNPSAFCKDLLVRSGQFGLCVAYWLQQGLPQAPNSHVEATSVKGSRATVTVHVSGAGLSGTVVFALREQKGHWFVVTLAAHQDKPAKPSALAA